MHFQAFEELDDAPLNGLLEDWERLRVVGEIDDNTDILDYIDVDDKLETSEKPDSFEHDSQSSDDEYMEE